MPEISHRTVRAFAQASILLLAASAAFAPAVQAADPVVNPAASAMSPTPKVPAALVFVIDVRWLGASPYRIERDVTVKIEQALKTLPDVKAVHSTVLGSRAQTQVSFDPRVDPSSTASAIRSRLDQIKTRLPHEASPPLISWRREPPTAP